MTVKQRLVASGYELPNPPDALGQYTPAKRAGELVFTSGQLPLVNGELLATGRVGGEVDVETAQLCARQAALNALAAIGSVADLEEISSVVRLVGYINAVDDFTAHPQVLNAASQVLADGFGDRGQHSRSAIGVATLPLAAPVELELVVSL